MCAGTEWLVPKSPVAYHTLGLLPVLLVFLPEVVWMAFVSRVACIS